MQKMRRNNLNFQPGQANFSRAVCVLRAGGGPWAVTWPWENETRAGRGQEMEILEFVGREKQAGKAPEVLRDFLLFSHENLSAGLWISLPSWWIFQWKRLVFVRFVNNTTWDEPEGKNICKSTLINEFIFLYLLIKNQYSTFSFLLLLTVCFLFFKSSDGDGFGFCNLIFLPAGDWGSENGRQSFHAGAASKWVYFWFFIKSEPLLPLLLP